MVVVLMTKNKIILFRGGMCGDIVLSMLDENYLRNKDPLKLQENRYVMKKFYNFSQHEKDNYYNNIEGYCLSHDTEYCKTIPNNVIQIYCSNENLLERFAKRFWSKNAPDNMNQLNHVMTDMNSTEETKVIDYKNSLQSWQNYNIFKHRFDIKNVFKNTFVDDVRKHFQITDLSWAKTVHESWLLSE